MSTLKILSDINCTVRCDFQKVSDIQAGELLKLQLKKGCYILEFLVEDIVICSMDYTIETNDEEPLLRLNIKEQAEQKLLEHQYGFVFSEDGRTLLSCNKSFEREMIIPEGVEHIGKEAFRNSKATSIHITDSVTSIGAYAFLDCNNLTSITIPNKVNTIEHQAFQGCSSLTSVTFGISVTSIGFLAFCGCSSLFSIMIPKSVTSIGPSAFFGCSGLTAITIPNSVTSIGSNAFEGCNALTSPVYNAMLFAYMPTTFSGSYNIPDGIKEICGGAFADCRSLTSIMIPKSVTSIGRSAFSGCSGLTAITIPNSVTSIGSNAFEGCSSLTAPIYNDTLFAYMPTTFSGLYNIPDGIKEICGGAFADCRSLTSIMIPKSVTSIGDYAFSGCSGLTSVTIPNSVTSIGDSAFSGCSGLTSVTIPNSVTSIGYSAFSGCSGLTSVTIPNSVTSIGGSAFGGCSGLISIIVEEGNTKYDSRNNCNAIIDKASNILIAGCRSTTIPKSTMRIGHNAFEGCSSLTSVTIPNSVTSIGRHAFTGCSGLTAITIPNSVKGIGIGAFQNCNGLMSVNISNNLTKMNDFDFCGCSVLTSVTIPNSVMYIGLSAFEGCCGLKSLIIPNSVTTIENKAFSGCHALVTIYIPESVTYMGDNIFEDCKSLQSIIVPFGTKFFFERLLPQYKKKLKEGHPTDLLAESEKDDNSSDDYEEAFFPDYHFENLSKFVTSFGKLRIRKGSKGLKLVCVNNEGDELYIEYPEIGNSDIQTIVDFSMSADDVAKQIKENVRRLFVRYQLDEDDSLIGDYLLVDDAYYNKCIKQAYAQEINDLHTHSFLDIRAISVRFIQGLSDEEKDELFEEINHGVSILSTNEQLHAYMYCFGLMHEAKLIRAFTEIPKSFFKHSGIEVVDYACGIGIATICFANFLEDNEHTTNIEKITLIEPSTIALTRTSLLCQTVCPDALVETIASDFDGLNSNQISSTNVPRVHLLSNILDMTCYDLNHLAGVIKKVKNKGDLFVCVDPWYHDSALDGRQRKLMRLLNGKEIYHDAFNAYQLQEDKTWTAYITIFRV